MRRILPAILCMVAGVCGAACSRSPAAPTAQAPSVLTLLPHLQSLSIAGLDADAVVNRPMQATAIAVFDDGTRWSITKGDWSSSDPGVASVDANGRVTPLSDGAATITLQTKAAAASFALRVFIDVGGTWEFTYLALDCSLPASSSFGCRRFEGPTPKTGRLAITQRGRSITGTAVPSFDLLFTGIRTVTGEVGTDRVLRMSAASCYYGDYTADNLYTVDNWQLVPDPSLAFEGQLQWTQRVGCDLPTSRNPLRVDVRTWNFHRSE